MNSKEARQLIHSGLTAFYTDSELRVITRALFEDLLKLKHATAFSEELLNTKQVHTLNKAISRLAKDEPLQYVTGKAHFFNLEFDVNTAVLIPRPETEELVEWVMEEMISCKHSSKPISLIDIGTGSGCIAISLKKNNPSWDVNAMDVSESTLKVAKHNATKHQAEINFICDDVTRPQLDYSEFDVIVSNPPYIPLSESAALHRRVTSFEPHLALFEPDDEPLLFYRHIIQFAKKYLSKTGFVIVEIHQDNAVKSAALFENFFNEVILKKDISDNYRMLMARSVK